MCVACIDHNPNNNTDEEEQTATNVLKISRMDNGMFLVENARTSPVGTFLPDALSELLKNAVLDLIILNAETQINAFGRPIGQGKWIVKPENLFQFTRWYTLPWRLMQKLR